MKAPINQSASTVAGDCSADFGLQSSEDFRGIYQPLRDSQPDTDRFMEPANRETLNDGGVTVSVVCLLIKLTNENKVGTVFFMKS